MLRTEGLLLALLGALAGCGSSNPPQADRPALADQRRLDWPDARELGRAPDLSGVDRARGDGPASLDRSAKGEAVKPLEAAPPTDSLIPTCAPAFGAADACGGSLPATWKISSACVSPLTFFMPLMQSCSGTAPMSATVTGVGGTITIATSTYMMARTGTLTAKAMVPAACVPSGFYSCNGVENRVRNVYPGTVASCTGSLMCNCTITSSLATSEAGNHSSTSASPYLLSLTPAAGLPSKYYYCIKGGVLQLRGLTANRDPEVVYVLKP